MCRRGRVVVLLPNSNLARVQTEHVHTYALIEIWKMAIIPPWCAQIASKQARGYLSVDDHDNLTETSFMVLLYD